VRQQSKKSKGEFQESYTSGSDVLRKRKIERQGFLRKPDKCLITSGVKAVKGDSPEGMGAKRRLLTSEGRQPLFSLLIH
jgi:hypothetical protein